MEKVSQLSPEQEVEAVMGIFGVDRMTAQALVAREHGETAGTCVAVDRHGKEVPTAMAPIGHKAPAA
jgi:hypothetical protein